MVPWAYFEHECIGPCQRLRIEKLQRFANYSEDLSPEAEVGPSVDFGEFRSGSITLCAEDFAQSNLDECLSNQEFCIKKFCIKR